MKFSLISDMHVNHPQPKTPYDKLEELVVVAGDTSNGLEGLKFLQKLRNKGHRVVAIPGNHEHYSNAAQRRTLEETEARFEEEYPRIVNFHYNEPTFICCNGWYDIQNPDAWYRYMNDGRFGAFSAEDINARALADSRFVEENLLKLKDQGLKAVVVTHTAPCQETLDPRFEGHWSNEWYFNPWMSPLLNDFSDTILVWCHGHTHAAADRIVGGTRVVVNPRGYPGENPDWEPKTIEVALSRMEV